MALVFKLMSLGQSWARQTSLRLGSARSPPNGGRLGTDLKSVTDFLKQDIAKVRFDCNPPPVLT